MSGGGRWQAAVRLLGWRQARRNDASTIMGMQLPGAYVLTIAVVLGCAALGLAGRGVERPGLYLTGIALSLVSALVLLSAPGDPMDWRATLFVAVVPSGALVLTALSTFEEVSIADAPASGLLALIQAFMCVRGRLWSAWLSYLFSVAVMLAVNVLIPPQPAFVAAIAPNTAVLLMATFFAAIVRPRARQIYTLRRQTERQIASAAAQEAAVAVRSAGSAATGADRQRAATQRRRCRRVWAGGSGPAGPYSGAWPGPSRDRGGSVVGPRARCAGGAAR